jgi:RimJ/RimL family protein N-acetyltransferase
MKGFKITHYQPGAIGRITELHALYYYKNSGFGLFFESKVATEMADFLNRIDPSRDGFWTAISKEKVIGSITIDGIKSKSDGNHLRWFIVDPAFHNKGVGTMLIKTAIEFCKKVQASRVYLWTFSGLDAARHLYEKLGFTLVKEQEATTWGVKVKEQLFELIL